MYNYYQINIQMSLFESFFKNSTLKFKKMLIFIKIAKLNTRQIARDATLFCSNFPVVSYADTRWRAATAPI